MEASEMATDKMQILREAIVQVLDTAAGIVALTGRADENIVAWDNVGEASDADRAAGIIAYQLVTSKEVAADANPFEVLVQFGAIAAEESIANELIGAIHLVFDAPAFLALVPPIDARVTGRARRFVPFDADEGLARADSDITLRVHFSA
jgi:hypothetical protein